MREYDNVSKAYMDLEPKYRAVIKDITQRMADGMIEFLDKGVHTVEDYDRYCHFVAGLVGIGLSRLFSESGREVPEVGENDFLSNEMGLFLQKTNIIRDYREDLDDNRRFWPNETWEQYAPNGEFGAFIRPEHEGQALACLNHMVTDALRHVPHCIEYLERIQDHHNFLFCAIPQVMAAHTLALVFNNKDVFQKVVKIRKGLTARLFIETKDLRSVLTIFNEAIDEMADKVDPADPSAEKTLKSIDQARAAIRKTMESRYGKSVSSTGSLGLADVAVGLLLVVMLATTALLDIPAAMGYTEAAPAFKYQQLYFVWSGLFYAASLAFFSSNPSFMRLPSILHAAVTAYMVRGDAASGNWDITTAASVLPQVVLAAALAQRAFVSKTNATRIKID